MSAFGYLLDRSVGLPSRAYRDSFYTRQTATLLQHAPSTSNFIFRQGMRVWSFSLDPAEQRFLLVGTSQSQLLVFDLHTLDEADATCNSTYTTTNTLDPICAVGAKTESAQTLQFGISMVDWYPVDGGLCISSSLDEHVKVWDFETFSCVSTLHLRSKIFSAKFSPVGTTHTLIAAATSRGEVRLVDMESGATAHSLLGHKDEIWSLDWSPASEFLLATGSRDGEIRLWDIRRSGATACLLCLNHEGKATVPGRSSLYTNVKRENPMSLSAAATARKRQRVGGASEAQARDRQRVRSRVDDHHSRLHASTYRENRNDPHAAATMSLAIAHYAGVTSLSYTPDGRFLLSKGMDDKLRLWNATSGEHQFMNYTGVRRTQPRAARNVQMAVVQEGDAWESTTVFVPNGSEGELCSYRVFGDNGAPLGSVTAHYQQITACLYRKTTREVYSAGEDGLIMKWKPPPVELNPDSVDEEHVDFRGHNGDVEAITGATAGDEDTWSEDEEDAGTGHEFIPPILRDEF
ncbi:DNA excision repair ERCC-8-like protein [Phytophthora infestans T30-4]|uniref:DNA excision repair ERCC-8-like protein n=2 Tax=Phytophthora infestans TaxID=4787 RepID=D0NJX5_PHYIT|nr:DNA excision repair ERCC-8-like protein [Phytophthora infestans T30-4]EEY59812.1 DNA excision repair ERCC-8-like protein [Phytophthora infestans T30-4]KAF4039450.1 WD domain G-beta repeat [Phytophthora infestans]KAF4130557.1 WD domain G-beta repeat domain-containing protein [Phytophthora infestans]KAF4135837.1 WD domain G-beta repeat domain-containing protein [Phytophthora infestans]|eukprot:XP_002900497.1 DNA excision repair ERCC-8-like protein [Phytophthora infestans T30-4]